MTSNDKSMVTLGLAAGFTLLVSAGMMLAGFVVDAMFLTTIVFTVFVVAFVSAPLFARLRISWPARPAVLGAVLGWALSAPLGALFNSAANVIWELDEPFEVLPATWLWALIPLVVVLVVSGIRQRIIIRDRY
ncbi:hypothetical protein ACX80E_00705 [Arthrobacter sp. TMN-49]